MASEPTDALREEFNQKLQGFENSNRYSYVKVLILYSEHGDHPGFQSGGIEFGEMLHRIFNYDVKIFAIPSRSSQLHLDSLVSCAILQSEDQARDTKGSSLLIIHYGDHGDSNDDPHRKEEKRFAWTARSQGGPTLEWFQIQSKFDHADIDVLLLLDCCFGAQAGRAAPEIPRRVEILSASAMGVRIPMPGPRSFTQGLIKGIEKCFCEKQFALTTELHAMLVSRKAELVATPVYIRLKHGTTDRGIRLERISKTEKRYDMESSGSLLRLRIPTGDPINRAGLTEIVEWLRNDAPRSIATMHIEEVLQETAQICNVLKSEEKKNRLNALNESSQDELVEEWKRIKSSLASYSAPPDHPLSKDELSKRSEMSQDILRQALALPQKLLDSVYQNVLNYATTDDTTMEQLLDHPMLFLRD